MQKQYRQGDVLFVQIKSIPVGERKKRLTGHILEGEATGHIHRVKESDLCEADVLEIGKELYLSVSAEGGISIVHEEHDPILLPVGNYEVIRQREYHPSEIRNVCD